MRVDDYRFYGQLCLIFGIVLLVLGIIIPVLTMTSYYYPWLGITTYEAPYLKHGIVLVAIGVILIVVSQMLYREYRAYKIAESKAKS